MISCNCGNARRDLYTPDQCRYCWSKLIQKPQFPGLVNEIKQASATPFTEPQKIQIRKGNCLHLGKVIDRAACNCPGKWVHECEKHGKCRRGISRDDIKSCFNCGDYIEDDFFPEV